MGLSDVLATYNEGVARANALREEAELAEERAMEAGELRGVRAYIAEPLAKALMPHIPAEGFDLSGPFGLSNEMTIEFMSGGARVGYLVFEPRGVADGGLTHIAYRPSRTREPMPESFDDIAELAREHAAAIRDEA